MELKDLTFHLSASPSELAVIQMALKEFIPEESKLAFLLALIILISCYNVEIAILVTVVAIVYVLVDNAKKNRNNENNQ